MLRMVLLLASLWLVVEGCEEKPKVEEVEKPKSQCSCCGIGTVTGAVAGGAAAVQGAMTAIGFGQAGIAAGSAFALAQSIGMSTVLGFVAAPLAIGAAVGGAACLAAAATTTCEC